jgi:hypothetical protein
MNIVDRQAIEDLFTRLKDAEKRGGPRDADAEALIAKLVARQPGAAYYLAQTVLVQQWALNAAHEEIEARQGERPGGGFFSTLFGGSRRSSPAPRQDRMPPSLGQTSATGFLATASNTAIGLAGGFVLHDLLAQGNFSDGSLANSFSQPPTAPIDPGTGMLGGDFGGGDFGGGGGGE